MDRKALVSLYVRPEGVYIASENRTVHGLWVGSGEVVLVSLSDIGSIGSVIVAMLDSCVVDVPHPQRDEWSRQRSEALDPLVRLAGLRSWRAFIREAGLLTVARKGEEFALEPMVRDERRLDVFYPGEAGSVTLANPTERELSQTAADLIGRMRIEREQES